MEIDKSSSFQQIWNGPVSLSSASFTCLLLKSQGMGPITTCHPAGHLWSGKEKDGVDGPGWSSGVMLGGEGGTQTGARLFL